MHSRRQFKSTRMSLPWLQWRLEQCQKRLSRLHHERDQALHTTGGREDGYFHYHNQTIRELQEKLAEIQKLMDVQVTD